MKKPSVFVVDDEPQIATLLTRILEREGYAVRSFGGAEQALDAIPADRPDLVVTDLMMPGMDGLELVRRAHAATPGIAAVLTTGYASIDNVVDALRSGVDDFVTKPFSVAEIRDVVARVMRRAAATREPPRGGDAEIAEVVHGLLADDVPSAQILPRCQPILDSALGVRRAALLAPSRGGASLRVRSATTPDGPWTSRLDVDADPVSEIVARGPASSPAREPLGAAAQILDDGAIAVAPLTSADRPGHEAAFLVVSRPAAAAPFGAEDLRRLGVLATAIGDVFRAIRATERAEDAYVESLCDVVAATETRSAWFAGHSERVRSLSLELGRRLGLSEDELDVLETAARLLDLGRVETPDGLLHKPGRPSDEEWDLLRRHAVRADDFVRPVGRLRLAKPVIRHHHENWDGTGYPDGLAGEEIPFLAALVRITDAYAALTSQRAWRPALDAAGAMRHIVDLSGRHFHPQLVAAFTHMRLESEEARA